MLNLQNRLQKYIDKYFEALRTAIKEIEFRSSEETTTHIKQLSKASKGDLSAKEYVVNIIGRILKDMVSPDDMNNIRDIVIEEYNILLNKDYPTFTDDSDYISYYQLIDNFLKDQDKNKLENINTNKITGEDEFTELMYSQTYGCGLLEPLLNLNINNIEVHGTKKIRVETNKGIWKTIKDYRFKKDSEVVKIAKNIIGQSDKEDITDENCMQEGTMSGNKRVTIGLKPSAKMNTIFIKKFDAFKMSSIDDLVKIGEITPEMLEEFKIYAKRRANIVFIGGINAGKTTLMNAYTGLIPNHYKIGIIESDFETIADELNPGKDILIYKETEKFSLNDLFKKMLRMNRDIISISESRGEEVLEFIKACTRGVDGSFSTIHCRNAHDTINNMAWMALESGIQMDIRILRYRIACAIDIIPRVWQDKESGKRIVDQVEEIIPVHDNLDMPYKVNTIFKRNPLNNEVKKVGNISDQLLEKFLYYNCTEAEVKTLIKSNLETINIKDYREGMCNGVDEICKQ